MDVIKTLPELFWVSVRSLDFPGHWATCAVESMSQVCNYQTAGAQSISPPAYRMGVGEM